jgi:hypothetical protein
VPERGSHTTELLARIAAHIAGARADLEAYRPATAGWFDRATLSANALIPWLVTGAPALKTYVEQVLNAPVELRKMWATIRPPVDLPSDALAAFDRQLELD